MKKIISKSKITRSLVAAGSMLVMAASLSGCYAFFQNKVNMDINSAGGSISDLLVPAEKITKLETPGQVYASQGMFSDKILVSWKEVEGASSYRIQRAVSKPDANGSYTVPEATEFEDLTNFCYSTVYTDTILSNPSTNNEEYSYKYYYRILAENIKNQLESENFTDHTKPQTQGMGWLFKSVTKLEASKGKSSDAIYLNWDSVPGAAYYSIYRGANENGTGMEELVTVRGNQNEYTNAILSSEQGKEFYYKICAKNSDGQLSAYSSLAMGYSLQFGAPSAPDNIEVLNPYAYSKNSLTVKWDSVDSPAPGKKRVLALYRTNSQSSVYKLLSNKLDNSATSFTDTSGLKPGLIYYYSMQTIDTDLTTGEVIKSSFSEIGDTDTTKARGFILSEPENISVEENPNGDGLIVKWQPAVGTGIEGLDYKYTIYSADSQNAVYEPIPGFEQITAEIGPDGYMSAVVDKKNFYKVSTINLAASPEIESNLSGAAAPVPNAPVKVEASKTKNLSKYGDIWTYNANEVYPVLITWEKPADDNPAGYNVYRSTKPDSSFKKISENPVTDKDETGKFFFIDKNDSAKAGTFYYYKVVSLNTLGQGTKGNDPAADDPANGGKRQSWGYGAITREQWFREYNREVATSQAKLVLMHKSNDLDKVGSETIYAYLPVNGNVGTLGYKAAVAGLGAEITMPYTNYADHTIVSNDKLLGFYFIVNGNTDTTSNMSANGNMHETTQCYHLDDLKVSPSTTYTFKDVNNKDGGDKTYTGEIFDYASKKSYKIEKETYLFQGMYPGYAIYNNLQIKSGAAGGGYYLVATYELDRKDSKSGTVILAEDKVDWLVGEEIRN